MRVAEVLRELSTLDPTEQVFAHWVTRRHVERETHRLISDDEWQRALEQDSSNDASAEEHLTVVLGYFS